MKNTPFIITALALALGIWFDILFYRVELIGFNLLLAEIAFLGAAIGLAYYTRHKLPLRAWVAAGFALAFAATFTFWTSSYGLGLSGIGFFAANVLFVVFMVGYEAHFRHPIELAAASLIKTPIHLLQRFGILRELRPSKLSDRGAAIAKGIIITIPILLVFILLFVGADDMLRDHLSHLFNWLDTWTNLPQIAQQLIIILFFGGLFLLFFAATFWRRFEIKALGERAPRWKIESVIILASVNVLFLAFILLQAYYLFGGQGAFDNIEGITYSEYMRHGFNELTIVAILVVGLTLTLRWLHGERARKLLLILHCALIGETVLILISAFLRLKLYIDTYAFTPMRLYGLWWLALLAILLVMLVINIMRQSEQTFLLRNSLIVVGAALLIFTILSPDALSVRLNIARASEASPLDPFPHFDMLSAEAVPAIKYVFESGEVPLESLIEPQPTLEQYCEALADDFSESAVGQDFLLRNDIYNWYSRNAFRGVIEYEHDGNRYEKSDTYRRDLKWQEWNLARMNLPFEASAWRTVDGDWEEVLPDWLGAMNMGELQAACSALDI